MPDKPRILVIDDDRGGCAEIQELLATAQLIVVGGVGHDEEALSVASALKPQVILIALDDSVSSIQTLRALTDLLPETAIISYSSLGDAHAVNQARALGAIEHLTKPLSQEELTSSVRRVVSGFTRPAGPQGASLPDTRGTVVTIFGPKGGIGRTLIAVNLAAAMADAGLGTVVVDVDTTSGDVARRLSARAERGLLDAVRNSSELDELTVDSYLERHASGVNVLAAPREPIDWREIDPEAVDRLLTVLVKLHRFVIIDTPAAFTDLSILAVHKANDVLLLSSLDPSSIAAAASALKMLSSSQAPLGRTSVVLNHLSPTDGRGDDHTAEALAHDVFWSLPYDESIAERDESGRPAVLCKPKAKISRSITDMAAALVEASSPASRGNVRSGSSSH